MKKLMITVIAVALGAFVGCAQEDTIKQAKIEANQQWAHTRATMIYSVAAEHLKVGQLDKAKAKAQEALALDEHYVDARLLLSKVYIEQGSYVAAINELTRVCQQAPNSVDAVYLLGVAREKDGQLDEAINCYRKSFAMNDKNISAITAIGEVLAAQGKVTEAQTLVATYIDQADEDTGMYELAGRLAMMQKEYDKAAKFYQQAHDMDVKNGLYMECLANAQFCAGKYPDAADTLHDLLAIKGRKPATWMRSMLGDCYMAGNRAREAREQYQLATDQDPTNAGLWIKLATAALKLGDNPRAVLSAQQALSLNEKNLEAALVMGYALIRDGQQARAIEVLSGAANHAKSAQLFCLLGRAYAAAGKDVKAAECYTTAFELEPENPVAKELYRTAAVQKISIAN